jgi:hypothetical protein
MFAVVFSSCTESSGVLKIGPDIYTVSTHASSPRGGGVKAQRMAILEASEFCANTDKEIVVTDIKTSDFNADVNFRCVDKGEPKFQQP